MCPGCEKGPASPDLRSHHLGTLQVRLREAVSSTLGQAAGGAHPGCPWVDPDAHWEGKALGWGPDLRSFWAGGGDMEWARRV